MSEVLGLVIGLAAVVLSLCMPFGVMYTIYRVRKLKTEERLAAIAKGVDASLERDLPHPVRSRRAGILLVASGVGFSLASWLVSLVEPEAVAAAALGVIPFSVGIGYLIDASLARRELQQSG
jgi:hypothetical protein